MNNIPHFSLNKVNLSGIGRGLKLINPIKASISNVIPAKIICPETLKAIFNDCLIKTEFPNKWKLADFPLIFKKGDTSRAKIITLSEFYPVYKKSLKECNINRKIYILNVSSPFMCDCRKSLARIIIIKKNMEKHSRSSWIWWWNIYTSFKCFWYY